MSSGGWIKKCNVCGQDARILKEWHRLTFECDRCQVRSSDDFYLKDKSHESDKQNDSIFHKYEDLYIPTYIPTATENVIVCSITISIPLFVISCCLKYFSWRMGLDDYFSLLYFWLGSSLCGFLFALFCNSKYHD